MGSNKLQQDTGEEQSKIDLLDGAESSSEAGSESRDVETVLPSPPSSGEGPPSDGLPVREEKKTDTPIAENHFETEASRVLFDAIDEIRSCGAGEHVGIPQLVIVGGQSTGKSSLLQSLTDIPFPVGMNTCTRFATRIESRRTAPGTPRQVKITIAPPDFKLKNFAKTPGETYREFVQVKDSLTAEEFASIVEQASTYLGINPGKGKHNKNFALEVLKVDISGPTRSHFSILDIPGIFSNDISVNDKEMDGVRNMAIEYMTEPKNIVICVADAGTDLMMQEIFKLANEHVDKTRLIGVFTKCDRLDRSLSEQVAAIASGTSDDSYQHLPNGWFVVRNRVDGDGDGDINFDLDGVEQRLFSAPPWTKVREERRGSAKLRQYLGRLLSDKIRAEFPQLLDEVKKLLGETNSLREKHGDARTTDHLRRLYLAGIAQKYEEWARTSLDRPWLITEEPHAQVRYIVWQQNQAFGDRMREFGHVYEFEDHYVNDEEYGKRLHNIFFPGKPQPLSSSPPTSNTATSDSSLASNAPHSPVLSSDALLERIRKEVRICGCAELPCFVHPDVIRRLYQIQTDKWHGEAETHLRAVAATIEEAARILLGFVAPPTTGDTNLRDDLRHIIDRLHDEALQKALARLKAYCDGDRERLLQTTDPKFVSRLQMLQSIRLMAALQRAIDLVALANESNPSVEQLMSSVFQKSHHSSENNTVFEVHDALKVYYQSCVLSFNHHITNTIVEDFVTDLAGPLKGFSVNFINGLSNDEVDRLGGESREVIEDRQHLDEKIQTLEAAQNTAQEALRKVRGLSVR